MKKYLLPETGKFFKSNLHCHTNLSDGTMTPEEVKDMYKKNGYSVVAYTDHNVFLPHNDLTDDEFLAMGGFEMDINEPYGGEKKIFNDIKTCHICLVSLDKDKVTQPMWHRTKHQWGNIIESAKSVVFDESEPDYIREYSPECINDIIKRGKEAGFFVTYNHPKWSIENYSDYMAYSGMDAMEIFNTGSWVSGFDEFNPEVYDDMLRGGKRLFCIATDDNHEVIDALGGWVQIKAESLTYENIAEALKNGDFYSSRGPEIQELWFEDGYVHIKCSDARKISYGAGRRSAKAVWGKEGELLCEASFEVLPEDKYFRLTVTDAEGNTANTNAYFTDELFK